MECLYSLEIENSSDLLQCINGPLTAIFNYYQYGELADYVGRELFFCYCQKDEETPIIIRKRKEVFDELEELNFNVQINTFTRQDKAWAFLYDSLSKGIISLIIVDSYFIPYSLLYQKQHDWHSVAVNGVHKNGDLYVFDHGYRKYNITVPQIELNKAWQSHNYKIFQVLKDAQTKDVDYITFKQVIDNNIKLMLNPTIDYSSIEEFDQKIDLDSMTIKQGLDGITALAEDIRNIKERKNPDNYLTNLYKAIHFGAEQCQLHSGFLKNAAVKFNIPEIQSISEEVKYISQEWMVARNMIIKSLFTEKAGFVERCAAKVDKIRLQEEKYIEEIGKVI